VRRPVRDRDTGTLKPVFHIPGNNPIQLNYAVNEEMLARKSDDELWNWLGVVTGGKIIRPSIIGFE
jgi:hypothetical protein